MRYLRRDQPEAQADGSNISDFVAAVTIIAFLIVGIQKIAQPQPECYAVIDERFSTDQEFVHNEA